jgi:hypothetical protein
MPHSNDGSTACEHLEWAWYVEQEAGAFVHEKRSTIGVNGESKCPPFIRAIE